MKIQDNTEVRFKIVPDGITANELYSLMNLEHLIAESVSLAGGNLCAMGHDWSGEGEGNRGCPHGHEICSQPVFRCRQCGEYDYGEKVVRDGIIAIPVNV